MRVIVSILVNLLIGSSLAGSCQLLDLDEFKPHWSGPLDGQWPVLRDINGEIVKRLNFPVYVREWTKEKLYMFRYKVGKAKFWAIGDDYGDEMGPDSYIVMKRKLRKNKKVECFGNGNKKCNFKPKKAATGREEVRCLDGGGSLMMMREKTDASAMMEGDAVTEQSASGLSSGDFMMMAAGAAIGALLVAVAVAVVVAMRKRKSAKRTEMEMTEAVHVPDSSVMTPDATEKKAEGDEEAVTVHSSHVAEVTVSVSMDDEAVQVDAGSVNES